MKTLIFLIALTAAAQYPPSSSNAKSLGGLRVCALKASAYGWQAAW